ncbi:hypothetical protein [Shewanella algidipiscicola]|uniref:hypothetical protein n=1 Tax=Shewanella algidipiscicola TaxID=614070 RepID=UPI0013C4C790|nr:hypothetical protein [Shewanella algidipiscicola]
MCQPQDEPYRLSWLTALHLLGTAAANEPTEITRLLQQADEYIYRHNPQKC